MRRERAGLVVLCCGVLLGCGGASETPPGMVEEARFEGAEQVEAGAAAIPDAALERARATADDLTRDLAGMVMTTLQEEGAVAAVEVCSGVAQERTASHAGEGVLVRRVTDRLRNPLNTPDDEEARELDRFEVLAGEGRLPGEIVRLVRRGEDRTLHYMRPIVMGQPCLTCHGLPEEIDPEVRAILAERYPDDAATGYRLGEFRGAVSVRVDLGPEQAL